MSSFLVFILSLHAVGADVNQNLKSHLKPIILETTKFQDAFVQKNTPEINRQVFFLRKLINQKTPVIQSLSQKDHILRSQKDHILRLFKKMETQLNNFLAHPEETNYRKIFFKSAVELAQVYEIGNDKDIKGFYCYQDKSSWLQTNPKPSNPVTIEYKKCGKRIF